MAIKIKSLDYIDDFLLDLDDLMATHGIKDVDITIQLNVSRDRVKVTGNLAYGQWRNDHCKLCGCRLRQSDDIVYCSSPRCSYIGGI